MIDTFIYLIFSYQEIEIHQIFIQTLFGITNNLKLLIIRPFPFFLYVSILDGNKDSKIQNKKLIA
jgi:hypothetical protein